MLNNQQNTKAKSPYTTIGNREWKVFDLGFISASMLPAGKIDRAAMEAIKELQTMVLSPFYDTGEHKKYPKLYVQLPEFFSFSWDNSWCPVPPESNAIPGSLLWILREYQKLDTRISVMPPLRNIAPRRKRHNFCRPHSLRSRSAGGSGWFV